MSNCEIVCADVVEWAEGYEGPPFHAMLCDAPYGLTNERREGICNRIARALIQISFPDFNEADAEFFEKVDLFGIALDGSPLSKRKVAAIIKSGIGVPKSTIDFNRGVVTRQEEIEASGESPFFVSDDELVNKLDTEMGQFLGDYILDTRDMAELVSCDAISRDFAEFSAGCFAVPIALVSPDFSEPLTRFLQTFTPGFADIVGLCDDSFGKAKTTAPVVADGRTVNILMLRFDLRRRSVKLFATYRASQCDSLSLFGRPKLIRASSAASCFSAPFEPIRVSLVFSAANGTNSAYFHLWLRKDFWVKLKSILPQNGFMGKSWDASLPDPEMWRQLANHLYPGAFGMVFSSARTYDQLARDLRSAGLILHPTVFVWLQGQGFPKATRVDAQIEKRRDDDIRPVCRFLREKMDEKGFRSRDIAPYFEFHPRMVDHWAARESDSQPTVPTWDQWQKLKEIIGFGDEMDAEVRRLNERKGQPGELWAEREVIRNDGPRSPKTWFTSKEWTITIPATELARVWEGHRYGLQAMKPAVEPVIVFQKPYEGRAVDCITKTGAGSLWVDGGRIGTNDDLMRPERRGKGEIGCWADYEQEPGRYGTSQGLGRWPANFVLVHKSPQPCPDCQGEGCETCGGEGVIGGCRRVGVRRVKASGWEKTGSGNTAFGQSSGWNEHNNRHTEYNGPAGGHNMEAVDDWECVEGCPARQLNNGTSVDKSVFLRYNEGKEKQEVNQCCGNASTAALNSMLDHLISGGDLEGFVAENVVTPADVNEGNSMLGVNKTSVMEDGIDSGENQVVENCTGNSKTVGSGNSKEAPSQKASMFTTLMETTRTMICPTCNSYLHLLITFYISGGEKPIASNQMEQRQGNVNGAKNISFCPNIINVQREHITATAKVAVLITNENGASETRPITVTTNESGKKNKSPVSRFFFQADWEHERVEMACSPECPVAKLDEQAGERPGGRPITNPCAESVDAVYEKYPGGRSIGGSGRQDSGGPSRFYHNADWHYEVAEQLAQTDPVRYCPKAAKKERNNGLADFYWRKDKEAAIGFVRVSLEEWEELGREEARIKKETGKRVRLRAQGNIHPTQKPIALTKWLATLLLPPKEYAPRRILVPFAGMGSEAIGTLLAGWEETVAVELYQDYCDAMEGRVEFWLNGRQLGLL